MTPEQLAALLGTAQQASATRAQADPAAREQQAQGRAQPGRIPSATPAVGDVEAALAQQGTADNDLYREALASLPPAAISAVMRAGDRTFDQMERVGMPGEEIRSGLGRAFNYVSQSPVLDTAVTGTGTYLDELASGTRESEAIKAGIRDASEYLRARFLDYAIPGGERPPNLSWGDVLPEMSPTEALLSDLATSAIDLAPLWTSAGRASLRAVNGGRNIGVGRALQDSFATVAQLDADRIRAAPGVRRRTGSTRRGTYGSFDEIPRDTVDMVLGTMDDATRTFFEQNDLARDYLPSLLEEVDYYANAFADPVLDSHQLETMRARLARNLSKDFMLEQEVADTLSREVLGRGREVALLRSRSPIQNLAPRVLGDRYPGFQMSFQGPVNVEVAAVNALEELGYDDLANRVRDIMESEAGEAGRRQAFQEALEEAQERVRLAEEGTPAQGPNVAATDLRINYPDTTPPVDPPSGFGAVRFLPEDASLEEGQMIFDILADAGADVARTGRARGVGSTDEILEMARGMSAQRTLDDLQATALLDPELEALVRQLEENPSGRGALSVTRMPPLDAEGATGLARRLAETEDIAELPELLDTVRVLQRRAEAGETIRFKEVVDDMAMRGLSRSLARDILRDIWSAQ